MAPAIAATAITDLGKEVKLKQQKLGGRSKTSQANSREVEDEDMDNPLVVMP